MAPGVCEPPDSSRRTYALIKPSLQPLPPTGAGVSRYDDSSVGEFGPNGAVVNSEGWRLCGTPRTEPHTPTLNPNGVIDSQSHTYRSSHVTPCLRNIARNSS